MVNLSELYTVSYTQQQACLCVYARSREALSLAVFILILLPVGGNSLLLVSQARSWASSREGGRGEPRAWLRLCCLLCYSSLKVRKGKRLCWPSSLLRDVSSTMIRYCVYPWRWICVPQLYCLQISFLTSLFFQSVPKNAFSLFYFFSF